MRGASSGFAHTQGLSGPPAWDALLLEPADSKAGAATRPARILIVEDDFFVSLELEHRLIEAGFEVTGVATTAEEAIEMAAVRKPELVIMDVRLAGKRDGVDAALELMDSQGIPSIFATAHADADTQRRAEKARPLAWVQKPYSPSSLIDLINATILPPRQD